MSYNPTIGRWVSEDPIGFQAADANLFRYVGNDPTNATDPTGTTKRVRVGSRPAQWDYTSCGCGWVSQPSVIPIYLPHHFIIIENSDGTSTTWGFDGVWQKDNPVDLEYLGWWWHKDNWPGLTGEAVEQAINELRPGHEEKGEILLVNDCQTTVLDVLCRAQEIVTKPGDKPLRVPYDLRAPGRERPIPVHLK